MSERMLSCTVSQQPGTGSRALLQSIDSLALVAVLSCGSRAATKRRRHQRKPWRVPLMDKVGPDARHSVRAPCDWQVFAGRRRRRPQLTVFAVGRPSCCRRDSSFVASWTRKRSSPDTAL